MTLSEKVKNMADAIEEMRIDIFQSLKVESEDDKKEKKIIDDMLFKIQSDMRYEVAVIVEYLE